MNLYNLMSSFLHIIRCKSTHLCSTSLANLRNKFALSYGKNYTCHRSPLAKSKGHCRGTFTGKFTEMMMGE